jgi:hypothetical protein
MASSDILSQTLSSITAIKLDEISSQRSTYEAEKAQLLKDVDAEPDLREKVCILLDRIESLSSMGKLKDSPILSLKNVKQFIEQARCDPSVSDKLQKDWQIKLENELDIHSLKYEYATLYGHLVNEWLSVSSTDTASEDGGSFEEVGRKEMHDQRVKWEDYVFTAHETDITAIHSYLESLFKSSKDIQAAFARLLEATKSFEKQLATTTHFDDETLTWVIQGILRSDLVSDEKAKVLKDFLNNKVVLAEVADVLNMRISSLEKWKWDSNGTPVEQRRQLNSRYRFYHDEDLLQTVLLRYIGVKWSVHFKEVLTAFMGATGVWIPSSSPVPNTDRKRREYFLGGNGSGVEDVRVEHFLDEIFLEQLAEEVDEKRGGYGDDSEDLNDTRKSGQQITQTLLHTLATEIIMKTRLGEEITVVRTDFQWFGPSLPHSTMFAVLSYLGVSDRWVDFFRRVLEAPMKFVQDGPDAPVQIRKRGTPISGPMSDMLAETVLFCLDFSFNQRTNGALMYRLHDDIWFWGAEKTCVKGWTVMNEFAELTGLEFNSEKTGSVKISRKPGEPGPLPSTLPKGDVRWGFLKLDSATGRFLIDQSMVDTHIEELRRQLEACKSIFDWIHAWNVYGARFFINNFGKPANCFGLAHVDMMLDTFKRIQTKLFASTGGSVTSTLKQMISDRFGVKDIPEGYLYFPMSMGGLDLKSPFVNLYLIRDKITKIPDSHMDKFFIDEEATYRRLKAIHEGPNSRRGNLAPIGLSYSEKTALDNEPFMNFEEYTRYREQTSFELKSAYQHLIQEPTEDEVTLTSDVASVLETAALPEFGRPPPGFVPGRGRGRGHGRGGRGGYSGYPSGVAKVNWDRMSSYQRWIIQLYAPDMIARFGGLNVVEKGLLPTGMVSMFRESRFKWQG